MKNIWTQNFESEVGKIFIVPHNESSSCLPSLEFAVEHNSQKLRVADNYWRIGNRFGICSITLHFLNRKAFFVLFDFARFNR
jgi:hypothetical protein